MLTWEILNSLNLARILICSAVLLYSCVTDWHTRRAPNMLWYVLGGAGLAMGLLELWLRDFDYFLIFYLMVGVIFIYTFVYLLFRMGAFGGADAKSLIAIAIMFPLYPELYISGVHLPLFNNIHSPVFSLSVLGNAVVVTLVVPIKVFLRNLTTVPLRELASNPLGSFTGYKMKIEDIKGSHVRLMHRYEEVDGTVKRHMVFNGNEMDDKICEDLLRLKKEGKINDYVWVTPKLPFLIPITLGFLIAVFCGDILMQVISAIIGML